MCSWLLLATRSLGLRRKPVGKQLLFAVGLGTNARQGRRIDLAIAGKIADGEFRSLASAMGMAPPSSPLRLGLVSSKSSISLLASLIDSNRPRRGAAAGENSSFRR